MNEQAFAGTVVGGLAGGAMAGVPGAFVGSVLGGLVGDAYSKKPSVGTFATTVRNDLAPENVSLDAHQIWLRITQGPGSATLAEASAAATQLSSNFAERTSQIAAARGAAAEAWQGNASSAADAATTPLADSFAVAQQQLAANHQALTAEVAAFDHIRSQVEFVPETPPQNHALNSANPFQTDLDAAINEYNAKAAKNIQLYEAYSAETAAARSQVAQSYAQPAPLSASSTAAATRTGSPIGAESVAPPQPGGAPAAGQPAATNASASPGGGSAPPSPGGASGMPGGTSGSGSGGSTDSTGRQTPSPTATPPGAVPTLPASRTYTAAPLPGQARPAGPSDLSHKPSVGGGGGGAFTGGGAVPGPISAGPGSTSSVRGGTSVGTGPVPGQTPAGVNRGPVGAAAARGVAGAGGMPMGAPGRGNDEEDKEHRRKYLIEPDDKELFGVDEEYVMPVIGDNR